METSQLKSTHHKVKKQTIAAVSAVAMGLAGLVISQNAAADANVFGMTGGTVSASIYNSDICSYSFIDISASENMVRNPPGGPTSYSGANIFLFEYNWCSYSYRYAFGSSNDITFNINASLNKATLKGSIPVWEFSQSCPGCTYNASVDATWSGTGELSRQSFNSHYSYGGYRYASTSKGNYRTATATLNVTGGSLNINGTASYAYMGTSQSHSVSVNTP